MKTYSLLTNKIFARIEIGRKRENAFQFLFVRAIAIVCFWNWIIVLLFSQKMFIITSHFISLFWRMIWLKLMMKTWPRYGQLLQGCHMAFCRMNLAFLYISLLAFLKFCVVFSPFSRFYRMIDNIHPKGIYLFS